MSERLTIRSAQSCATDAQCAVQEFYAGVVQDDMALVVFFCSTDYDLDALAEEFNRLLPGVPVIGCTSAGEIGPAGYRRHSLVGCSFSGQSFTVVTGHLDNLQDFEISQGRAFAHDLLQSLESRNSDVNPEECFGFLLIDGLSVREEAVVRAFQHALGHIPIFGGSAGDDLQFGRTQVFHKGAFHDNSTVLTLIRTDLPFRIFKTQHFVCDEERLVVTEADSAHRIVREINGLPAAQEYARLVGCDVAQLSPSHFAAAPLVVVIDGTEYVRSIQKANADGSLTFYCAIDEGLVLRRVHGLDILANLESALADVRRQLGTPQLVLACDCILRQLEITEQELTDAVGAVFKAHHTIGFNTYGEQFGGVHVNQTLTAIAIGHRSQAES